MAQEIIEDIKDRQTGVLPLKQKAAVVVPHNIAVKCPGCKEILYERNWKRNQKVCPHCHHHFRLTADERIEALVDAGSFVECGVGVISSDPLRFVSQSQVYTAKLAGEREKTGLCEAVVIGHATVEERPLALAVMDFRFIGGSMGAAVGEKITRAIEIGIERHIPVLIVTASGGARMQEGIYSLMQMARTSAVLVKLAEAGLPCFSLLTDPTTGGVTASFAMLGDVILAEPGGLICFAGPRVIEQFMHRKLPKNAATSEFVFEHGFLDMIVHRHNLRPTIAKLLRFYRGHDAPELVRSPLVDGGQL